MIIKTIEIENFLCYYGKNKFEFVDGLNVILGDNGEGKTKFFEAIEWLFKGDNKFVSKISAKALNDAEIEESFDVCVTMSVEQYGELKTVKRLFSVVKNDKENDFTISKSKIIGIQENKKGEREKVDGETLLANIFPDELRRYSLFKGESQLNIFENRDALNDLINSFSTARYYEKYLEIGEYLKNKSEKAVERETLNNSKKKKDYQLLELQIEKKENELNGLQKKFEINEQQLEKINSEIKDIEKHVHNSKSLKVINERIKKIRNEISTEEKRIKENYTTYLFDDYWILSNFEKINQSFVEKVNELERTRRDLQQEFDKEEGKRLGKKQLAKDILDGKVPLPLKVPSKKYMNEMIDEEFCKVCNRPAKKGSQAYEFMKKRLEEYEKSQESETKKDESKKELFKSNFINGLFRTSIRNQEGLSDLRKIPLQIKDLFEFNRKRKESINDLEEKLKDEIQDRSRIIGNSTYGEDDLINIAINYTAWQRDLAKINRELAEQDAEKKRLQKYLEDKITEKEAIDLDAASSFLIKTRGILRDIEIVFRETKEAKYDEFIKRLEGKSNTIFGEINIDDFTGKINLKKKIVGGKPKMNILLTENEKEFYNPNQSLKTSMHMAILFAISELAAELKNENYPMIFDAPTSSFGETKTRDFLNLIYKTKKQRIILFYDFIGKNKNGKQFIKPEFEEVDRHKAFWIRREPFDKNDLGTINTNVYEIS